MTNPATGAPSEGAKKRARASEGTWRLEPHACRLCFGRIASQDAGAGLRRYECAQCGHAAVSDHPRVVCGCGIRLRKGDATVDAGIRCHENQMPTPDFPARYVCSYQGGDDPSRRPPDS